MQTNKINENKIELELDKEGLNSFILYLLIGILYSIKNKTVSPDIGIWSLRRPIFFEPLKKLLPKDIIEILEISDELSALEELSKIDFTKKIDFIIEKLLSYLNQIDNQNFLIKLKKF